MDGDGTTGTARRSLARTGTARSLACLGLGGALLVTVSLGPMADELGSFSVVVWFVTALIGLLQCSLIAWFARRFPHLAGGTPSYVHGSLGRRRPLLGVLASWSYWFAWTPGIVVNLTIAGEYLAATVLPGVPPLSLALGLALALYAVNAFGIRLSEHLVSLVGLVATVPLLFILAGIVLRPETLQLDRLTPIFPTGAELSAGAVALLILKWAFVAAWSSYGGELASTAASEVANRSVASRCIQGAGIACLFSFTVIPLVMALLVGPEGMARDAQLVFLAPAEAVFGPAGRTVVAVMLAAGLALGAHAFIVGSSRTVYQLASWGYLPSGFSAVNRFGAPTGSLVLDAAVVVVVLVVLGAHVLLIVAAANVGYLLVFVLLPYAFIRLNRAGSGDPSGRSLVVLAHVLLVVNVALLVVGAPQWGWRPMLLAVAVLSCSGLLSRRAKRVWRAELRRQDEDHGLIDVRREPS